MFLKHGNFNDMEVAIKKRHVKENSTGKQGGWYTKAKLEQQECWSKSLACTIAPFENRSQRTHPIIPCLRKMIDKAWAWGKASNCWRAHPIHGEEEIYITVAETFAETVTNSEEMTKSGALDVKEIKMHYHNSHNR